MEGKFFQGLSDCDLRVSLYFLAVNMTAAEWIFQCVKTTTHSTHAPELTILPAYVSRGHAHAVWIRSVPLSGQPLGKSRTNTGVQRQTEPDWSQLMTLSALEIILQQAPTCVCFSFLHPLSPREPSRNPTGSAAVILPLISNSTVIPFFLLQYFCLRRGSSHHDRKACLKTTVPVPTLSASL